MNTTVIPANGLAVTDEDRLLILGMVRAIVNENAPIVITHSTDSTVETGLYLQRELPELKIPVVLTGAMTPLGFENSDGLQNLTESLMAARLLQPGVYLVMHGTVFPVHRVRKIIPAATSSRLPIHLPLRDDRAPSSIVSEDAVDA